MEHWGVYENSLKHVRVEVLVFKERGKPEYPEKNLSEQGREPTTTQPTCGVVVISSEYACWNIRNVIVKVFFFPEIRLYFLMFITAVCFLFLLKLRWPKNKSIYY